MRMEASPEKRRGGYYTPPAIARFLARWVTAPGPESLLEPSCGDGAFFAALAGARARVLGFETDAREAAKARARARELGVRARVEGDFLAWALERIGDEPRLGGALGNPPFIRYQYLPSAAQGAAERLFGRLALGFTRHMNAWVPFVAAALRLLAPGARLGMVVPAELFHVLYAQSLRSYLLDECERVVVIDPRELWFERTLQGVVLLLAEKRTAPGERGRLAIVSGVERAILDEDPEAIVARAKYVDGAELDRKWMAALLDADTRALLATLSASRSVARLGALAQVDVGIVTGANDFFLVAEPVADAHGLRPFCRPMFGRAEHVRGLVYDARAHRRNAARGVPAHFVDLGARAFPSLPKAVQRYIESGEARDLHRRYKCRIRSPWYAVPSVWAAPLAMLKRSHDHPRLILNTAGAFTTDTAYRLRPRVNPARLTGAFVNSLTMLSAELEGRHYGGGVLELVPSEIERLLVPWPAPATRLRELDRAVAAGLPAESLLRRQDAVMLGALGITADQELRLRSAWSALRRRRQRQAE